MKELKRPMLLCEFLMRAPILAGLAAGAALALIELIVFAAVNSSPIAYTLLSDAVENSGWELILIAGIFVSMGVLAALIARIRFGSRSAITLHMLPVARGWMLVGWIAGGLVMMLSLVIFQHIAVRIADEILLSTLVAKHGAGEFYREPNRVWLTFLRVDFLHFVLPRSVLEWFTLVTISVGAPTVTTSATLGVLSGRKASAITGGAAFVLCAFLMRAGSGLGVFGGICVTVVMAIYGYKILMRGDLL